MNSTSTDSSEGTRPTWVPQQPQPGQREGQSPYAGYQPPTYQYAPPVRPASYPSLPPAAVYPPLPPDAYPPGTWSYPPSRPRRRSRLIALVAAGIVVVAASSVAVAVSHGHSSAASGTFRTTSDSGASTTPSTDNLPVPQASSEAPSAAPTPTPVQTLSPGEAADISQNGVPAAQVTVSQVVLPATSTNEFNTPDNGQWVMVTVSVTENADYTGTFDINPFDFYVRGSDGSHYDPGNSAGFDPSLDAVTLNAGETASGKVNFDVPATLTHGELVYAPSDQAIVDWSF